jgi:excinuclease ABC subunit B
VAILDADKEGFLRGSTSLIQTIGRAARNVEGFVVMYADRVTDSMRFALEETDRRRAIQLAYNEKHGITAATVVKGVSDISDFLTAESKTPRRRRRTSTATAELAPHELDKLAVEEEMLLAAQELRFEYAARLRDELRELRRTLAEAKTAA